MIFFLLLQPKSYRKMFVENSKGVTQSEIRTFVFLINGQIYWQAANNGATHIFHMVFPYSALFSLVSLWLLYSPEFPRGWGHGPLAGAHGYHDQQNRFDPIFYNKRKVKTVQSYFKTKENRLPTNYILLIVRSCFKTKKDMLPKDSSLLIFQVAKRLYFVNNSDHIS